PYFDTGGLMPGSSNGQVNVVTVPLYNPNVQTQLYFRLNLSDGGGIPMPDRPKSDAAGETLTHTLDHGFSLFLTQSGRAVQGPGTATVTVDGLSSSIPLSVEGVALGNGFLMLRGEFKDPLEPGESANCSGVARFSVSGGALDTFAEDGVSVTGSSLTLTGSGRDGRCNPFQIALRLRRPAP
ncbi:MAG TPA: hypothetical protein VEA38_05290, partial [Terriglobales bacterium]|nr:hypothetical protein [Terriglobales bacterium]